MHLVTFKTELKRIIADSIARLRQGKKSEEAECTAQKLEALRDEDLTNEAYHNCYPENRRGSKVPDFVPECSECHTTHHAVVKVGPDEDPGDYGQGAITEVWLCRPCLTAALALLPAGDYKDRDRLEHAELVTKITKLEAYLADKSDNILFDQLEAMHRYRDILAQRIAAFPA